MTNYYQVQRSTSEIKTVNNKGYFAVLPFYLPKHGEINAFEFAGFKYKTGTEEPDPANRTTPKGFRAYLFSCIAACQEYVSDKYNQTISASFLKRIFRGEPIEYTQPKNYSGNPGEYIIVGGPSIRDNETEWGGNGIEYPATNCIHITYAHGDRPFYSEDGERFWTVEDGCYYLAIVEWDKNNDPTSELDAVTGILYYR